MGRMGTTVTAGWPAEEQKDRAGDCARCLAAKRWAGVPRFPGGSHFRAGGSWHRMLWPENLTTQECCAPMSSCCTPLTPGWELPVLLLRPRAPLPYV